MSNKQVNPRGETVAKKHRLTKEEYLEQLRLERINGEPYQGTRIEDRPMLEAMEKSAIYDDKIMNTTCNR